MPALALVGALVLSAGATVVAMMMLGPDSTEKQRECVEALLQDLEPTTKAGLQEIVRQCDERYAD